MDTGKTEKEIGTPVACNEEIISAVKFAVKQISFPLPIPNYDKHEAERDNSAGISSPPA